MEEDGEELLLGHKSYATRGKLVNRGPSYANL